MFYNDSEIGTLTLPLAIMSELKMEFHHILQHIQRGSVLSEGGKRGGKGGKLSCEFIFSA
jgi:hypothetical protein